MLESALFTMDNVAAEVRVEIGRIAQNLQETTNTLFGLILSFLLQVN